MRHHNTNRKFGREKDQRAALIRSLMRSLILTEKITTTEAKAKELRPAVEKLVTRALKGDLAARRLVLARLGNNKEATEKLFGELSERYKDRNGGYTRIIKLSPRAGATDGSKMAVIEFV